MSRRPSLPGAAELFRTTALSLSPPAGSAVARPAADETAGQAPAAAVPSGLSGSNSPNGSNGPSGSPGSVGSAVPLRDGGTEPGPGRRGTPRRRVSAQARRGSGRQRHEEKITVYCSAEELLDLESARLALRADHDLVVDRGRMVREAVAVVLADLEARGEDSVLVRRLRES
ncbi:MAG TPA: cobyrinic acid a,c-diamide synthase [Mycobacteriales bacterium]|nr:cobyrinic acid a,c-diamide synthase [Mycobacteriales bacterium]